MIRTPTKNRHTCTLGQAAYTFTGSVPLSVVTAGVPLAVNTAIDILDVLMVEHRPVIVE